MFSCRVVVVGMVKFGLFVLFGWILGCCDLICWCCWWCVIWVCIGLVLVCVWRLS